MISVKNIILILDLVELNRRQGFALAHGFLDADEFEMPQFGRRGNQGGSGGAPMGDMGEMRMPSKDEIFNMADQNGDGKIEKSEMRFGTEGFDDMDQNGDGFITKDEFEMPSFGGGPPGGGSQGGGYGGFTGGSI